MMSLSEMLTKKLRLDSLLSNRSESSKVWLCWRCRRIPLKYVFLVATRETESAGPHRIELGSYDAIQKRTHCPLCKLVLSLLTEGSFTSLETLEAISKEPQNKGCILSISEEYGEVDLSVSYCGTGMGRIKLVTEDNHKDSVRQAHGIRSVGMKETLRQVQGIGVDQNDQEISVSRVHEWLTRCLGKHDCCKVADLKASRSRHVQLLAIDVLGNKLVSISSGERYIALSYVWGGTSMLQTTKANISSLKTSGALGYHWEQLPHIIQDSISFVRMLGERYLWVDSLCIIQDDECSKRENIKGMNKIYNQAFFTIVALSAQGANSFLPGVRPHTRPPQPIATIRKLPLAVVPPDLYQILDRGFTYDSRGWTFQERVLSRRCIYFTEKQLYFNCYEATACETRRIPDWNDTLQMFNRLAFAVRRAEFEPRQNGSYLLEDEERDLYRYMVEGYTNRNLSYKEDILNGFKGILAVMKCLGTEEIVNGVPLRILDAGLLWIPAVRGIQRRVTRNNVAICSSWSWAGWLGKVHYMAELRGNALTERLRRRLEDLHVEPLLDDDSWCHDPDLKPRVLRFSTETLPLSSFSIESSAYVGFPCFSREPMHRILDLRGKHCGMIFSSRPFLPRSICDYGLLLISSIKKSSHISDDRSVSVVDVHMKFPGRTIHYVRRYDENIFDDSGSQDHVLNIMIVEWKSYGLAERVALAQIHAQAWREAGPEMKVVRLG